jgi:glycosyltransferase involved in cell wall biosynthesis
MQTPLVTVTLIAYNAEAYIKDAIEGCLMQQVDFPYELIIHDDASKDRTQHIISEYAKQYPDKIFPITQTENQFSKGNEIYADFIIPKARGKYIAFMEADDYWIDPLKLQKQIDFMENHTDFSMCFTGTKEIRSSGSKKVRIKRYRNRDSVCSAKDVILMGGRLVDMISAVVRKSIYDDVPAWYHYSQIWDNTIPLLALTCGKIQYLNEITAVYRYNVPGGWTQKNVKDYKKRANNIRRKLTLLDGFNKGTDYRYNNLILRLTRFISIGLLLLLDPQEEVFIKYYSRLSPFLKFEYKFFNSIGSYRLWERYRQFVRLFRKTKQI